MFFSLNIVNRSSLDNSGLPTPSVDSRLTLGDVLGSGLAVPVTGETFRAMGRWVRNRESGLGMSCDSGGGSIGETSGLSAASRSADPLGDVNGDTSEYTESKRSEPRGTMRSVS